MLTAIPKSVFTWNFELREGSSYAATLDVDGFAQTGRLSAQGRTWEMDRERWLRGNFFLKRGSQILGKAVKPSLYTRSFEVSFDSDAYTWVAKNPFSRTFVLRREGRDVGSMRPERMFRRKAAVELPEGLALEQRAFLVWLALLMWRKKRN